MKKGILGKLITYTVLCASTLVAQDSLTVIGKFSQGHPWTMDFAISSNLTLRYFQGTAISLSKFISDYQKYRLGISTNLNSSSGDQSGNQYSADTLSSVTSGTNDNNTYSYQITFQYIAYATPRAQTSVYYGIGPLVGISGYKNNTSSNSAGSYKSQQSSTDSHSNYSVGALGSCGVEWFFSEHISIHAEYGLSAQYTWSNGSSGSANNYDYGTSGGSSYKSNSTSSSSGWSLSGQSVLFGLSVNF